MARSFTAAFVTYEDLRSLNRGTRVLGKARQARLRIRRGTHDGCHATKRSRDVCVEKEAKGGLESYGEALWWTATIATFFLECDAESAESEVSSAASIAQIRTEITALRSRIAALLTQKDH